MQDVIALRDRNIISSKDVPLVTVFTWVFNDKNYIKECIESILSQKTNFNVEIIIHDDASTDGTRDIILEYEQMYPKLFKNILQDDNQWSQGKSVMKPLFDSPRGKYIALTHGDDYWKDQLKLQKQVDFLESNIDFSMSFHSVGVINEIEGINYKYPIPNKDVLSFSDILFKHYIPTCSIVYRSSSLFTPIPNWFFKVKSGDIALELLLADRGKVKYFHKKMAVYRKHGNGVSQDYEQKRKGRKSLIKLYVSFVKFCNGRHLLVLLFMICKNILGLIKDKLINK